MYDLENMRVKTRKVGLSLLKYKDYDVVEDDLPSKVDPCGYVDPNIRIQEMMKAGIRLDEMQRALYDFKNPDHVYSDEDLDYVNMDIYKTENELLEEGYHSLDIYRKKIGIAYRKYLDDIAHKNEDRSGVGKKPEDGSESPQEETE